MKVRLEELKKIEDSKALEALKTKQGLSATKAYHILKVTKVIDKELETYRNVVVELLNECAQKDEKENFIYADDTKQSIKLKNDKTQKWVDETTALLNEEVELSIKKLTLDDIEEIGLSPQQIESIEFLLDLEEETN